MSEHQIFCWSENYNDSFSKQQMEYRVFNKQVSEDRYNFVLRFVRETIPNKNNLDLMEFWKGLSNEQIQKLSTLKEFDSFGFEYITGRKVEKELTEVEKAVKILYDAGLLISGQILKIL